jgi:hypothetical protein
MPSTGLEKMTWLFLSREQAIWFAGCNYLKLKEINSLDGIGHLNSLVISKQT